MLHQLLVLFSVTSVALAALAIQPLEEKPEEYKDCDGCWVSEINQLIPLGEARPSLTNCWEYRCTDTYVEIASCGTASVKPPCSLIEDKSLPYPQCCARPYCPSKQ